MLEEIFNIIHDEENRQKSVLRMIPSENQVSDNVRKALGSVFTNKYAEGYPGKRYYQGQENTDRIELLAQDLARKVFKLPDDWHVNVQPYSGSPANIEVYNALCKPGDKVVGLGLSSGGHLTHGHKVNFSGKMYEVHQYDVDKESGLIDYIELEKFITEVNPTMVIIGTTAYSRIIDWQKVSEICKKVGCYFVADIAHVAGLIAGEAYPSPIPFADVVTMTTHKTLRGPRGGLIFCKDSLAKKIDRSVFPGCQGGPHMNQIAALSVALTEASTDSFKEYAHQIVSNAKKLSDTLKNIYGFNIVSNGTDSHLLVVDVTSKNIDGKTAAESLEKAGIECNFNTIPYDPLPPSHPSGIRLGTPTLTTIGMKEDDMVTVAAYINKVLDNYNNEQVLASVKEEIRQWVNKLNK